MKFEVALGERSYEVVVESGARHGLAALIATRAPKAKSAVIVTSDSLTTYPWFEIESGLDQHILIAPEGESAKSISSAESLLESLAALRLSRDDVIVGVGGGAITDLAGFVAATYLRGISLIQVPTSLVGQVDAAIGGKTGVNLKAGKNLVGAFYQPLGVLCDLDTLTTLPERELLGGLGEVAKCWLLEGRDVSDLASTSQLDLIALAIGLKARIVSGDEREGGERALLNYGHTLAHALEKLALGRDRDELRHGEAVAIGLAFAARLAHQLERVGEDVVRDHDAVLASMGLDGRLPADADLDAILETMKQDKKAHHDLSFILAGPKGFSLVPGVDPRVVHETLERFKGES